MATYHFTARLVRRKEHRLVTQVAAYKFADKIKCARSGETFDYRKNSRVIWSTVQAPAGSPDCIFNRSRLWNAVEQREVRKDAQLAREYEVALPAELTHTDHTKMMETFAAHLVERFSLVVGCAIHLPRREGDQRNVIGVMLMPTRRIENGVFTTKLRDLSVLPGAAVILKDLRRVWADITNAALEQAGFDERVDHRTLAEQRQDAEQAGDAKLAASLDREPGKKLDRRQYQAARRRRYRAKQKEDGARTGL